MLLNIKVKPGSKSDSVTKDADGNIHIRIKTPPVDGKANKYLLNFLADYFDIRKSEVVLIKGETSQHKTFRLLCDERKISLKLAAISIS